MQRARGFHLTMTFLVLRSTHHLEPRRKHGVDGLLAACERIHQFDSSVNMNSWFEVCAHFGFLSSLTWFGDTTNSITSNILPKIVLATPVAVISWTWIFFLCDSCEVITDLCVLWAKVKGQCTPLQTLNKEVIRFIGLWMHQQGC